MGHLICINKCYNSGNKPFKIGSIYKYYDTQYIDLFGVKYYTLFEINKDYSGSGYRVIENKFGSGRKEFIDMNFTTIAQWSRILKDIDLEFDKIFWIDE